MNPLLQIGQTCGLSSECILECTFKLLIRLKDFEQTSQEYGFKLVCIIECLFSLVDEGKALSHSLKKKRKFPTKITSNTYTHVH